MKSRYPIWKTEKWKKKREIVRVCKKSLCILRVHPYHGTEELKIEPLLFRVHVEWNTKGEHCLWFVVMRSSRRLITNRGLGTPALEHKSIILFVNQLTLPESSCFACLFSKCGFCFSLVAWFLVGLCSLGFCANGFGYLQVFGWYWLNIDFVFKNLIRLTVRMAR